MSRDRGLLLVVAAALLLLWGAGTLGRGLWTPDEPREADISWRMSGQPDRTVPYLAQRAFPEKPPLAYWLAAAGIEAFGPSPGAMRVANIVYLGLATACVALVAAGMAGPLAGAAAAVVFGTMLLVFRVGSWLATDAPLLAAAAIAALGMWIGLEARTSRRRVLGYGLLHLGAALGFMAKSGAGWLAPGVAFLAIVAVRRRWAELLRPELYLGFVVQALVILPWLWLVWRRPDGADVLRVMFWNNLAGRFTRIDAPAELRYFDDHPNSPGKYLLELPLYLLPWTIVALAALWRGLRAWRDAGETGFAWTFALAHCLPLLAVLSVMKTARDVYAAPVMIGICLAVALWASPRRAPDRGEYRVLAASALLVALVAIVLAVATVGVAVVETRAGRAGPIDIVIAAVVLAAVAIAAWAMRPGRARAEPAAGRVLGHGVFYAAALAAISLALFPHIDRWQDLDGIGRALARDIAGNPAAILNPDETTEAFVDRAGIEAVALRVVEAAERPAAVAAWFARGGGESRLIVQLPDRDRRTDAGIVQRVASRLAAGRDDGVAGELQRAGAARLLLRYELPMGRRYALLGPP